VLLTSLGQTYSFCFLALVIDDLEERLVILVLSLIHAALCAQFLIVHLPVQELGILLIDALYLIRQADFFFFMYLFIFHPHDCLLVIKPFFAMLSILLLAHLLIKIRSHV